MTSCDHAVVSGVVLGKKQKQNCTIGTQSQRQPCEKEKMAVNEIKRKTSAFVTRGVKDLEWSVRENWGLTL